MHFQLYLKSFEIFKYEVNLSVIFLFKLMLPEAYFRKDKEEEGEERKKKEHYSQIYKKKIRANKYPNC